MNVYFTSNRTVEQFLWSHRIPFEQQTKVNGRTVWVYTRTPELERVLREYESIYAATPYEYAPH